MDVRPRLLNPTKVKIEQIDNQTTRIDPVRRQPINFVKKAAAFEIEAQIKWVSNETLSKLSIDSSGRDEQQAGYLILRQEDLSTLGKEIKVNDKIIQIETHEVSLYVWRVDFGSHYKGDFSLLKIHFSDRRGQ